MALPPSCRWAYGTWCDISCVGTHTSVPLFNLRVVLMVTAERRCCARTLRWGGLLAAKTTPPRPSCQTCLDVNDARGGSGREVGCKESWERSGPISVTEWNLSPGSCSDAITPARLSSTPHTILHFYREKKGSAWASPRGEKGGRSVLFFFLFFFYKHIKQGHDFLFSLKYKKVQQRQKSCCMFGSCFFFLLLLADYGIKSVLFCIFWPFM